MARHPDKARTKPVPAGARVLRGKEESEASTTLQLRLAAAERECDALRGELRRCEARMRRLEDVQAQARERVAWALNSLQEILASHR